MNCCNDYGACTQCMSCPARAIRSISVQTDESTPSEAGNWMGDSEAEQLTTWETISFWGIVGLAAVCTVIFVGLSVGVLAKFIGAWL